MTVISIGRESSSASIPTSKETIQVYKGEELTRKVVQQSLSGLSEKELYQNREGKTFLLKSAKPRTVQQIFGASYLKKFYEILANDIIEKFFPAVDRTPENKEKLIGILEKNLNEFHTKSPIGEKDSQQIIDKLNKCVEKALADIYSEFDSLFLLNDNDKRELKLFIFEKNEKLIRHVGGTLVNFMHTEILGPKVAKAIWKDEVVVPNTYYLDNPDLLCPKVISKWLDRRLDEFVDDLLRKHIAKVLVKDREKEKVVGKDGNIINKSKSLRSKIVESKFVTLPPNHESLSDEEFAKKITINNPLFWEQDIVHRPSIKSLNLSNEQKMHLGKLYAMALVTGHYDILNNLTGTNSGSAADKPACVDWGNTFYIGYSGLTKAENASAQDRNPSVASLKHSYPYEGVVSPDLPRMLVKRVFKLTDKFIGKGFKDFIQKAYAASADTIREAVQKSFDDAPPAVRQELSGMYDEVSEQISEITKSRIDQIQRVVKSCRGLRNFTAALREDTRSILEKTLVEHRTSSSQRNTHQSGRRKN